MRATDLLKTAFTCVAIAIAYPAAIANAGTVNIGVAAPLTGPFEILGHQMQAGARDFASRDSGVEPTIADDRCDAEGGTEAANLMVEARVGIATGFLCTEAIVAALPILAGAGIPVLATGVRTDNLTDKASDLPPVFRMVPRSGDEERAVAAILVEAWRADFFAIVDDGTIHARELAESLRLAAENAGLTPGYVDTFRPQLDNQIGLVGRLKKAGVTHVFAAGDRADIAIIARDAAAMGVDITVAGGEALMAADDAVPLPAGVLAIAPMHLMEGRHADPMNATLETSGFWRVQYAATSIAAEALRIAAAGGGSVRDALLSRTFETSIGPVRFAEDGTNLEATYALFRYDGANFELVEALPPSELHSE